MEIPDWFIEDGDGILLDIGNPSIPDAVREHGLGFKNPACYVHDFGGGSYLLYAQNGELLDILTYRSPS